VVAVQSVREEAAERDLYVWAASAEQRSEHPLGKAVVRCYGEAYGTELLPVTAFQMLPGRGVRGTIDGGDVVAGNEALLRDQNIALPETVRTQAGQYLDQGCTLIYLARDGQLQGFLALADTLRPDAENVISNIRAAGIAPVLLTGDNEKAAGHIAGQLGVSEVRAGCLPEDKLTYIDQAQQQGQPVCMIGDGINDAPALKMAQVGIAMGGIGSDIAVDAADIALVHDEIRELPHLLRLSRHMMRVIKCNLTFSMTLNFVAIVLAITGILNPVVGALVHNAGSVFVIVNSAFLLSWRPRT
jgi:P-type E1-E2 ATPase